jgi:hypothetical protein
MKDCHINIFYSDEDTPAALRTSVTLVPALLSARLRKKLSRSVLRVKAVVDTGPPKPKTSRSFHLPLGPAFISCPKSPAEIEDFTLKNSIGEIKSEQGQESRVRVFGKVRYGVVIKPQDCFNFIDKAWGEVLVEE